MKWLLALTILMSPIFDQDLKIVEVHFKEMLLTVKDRNGNVLCKFPVALPAVTPALPAKGLVRKIEINGAWYPTPKTRAAYFKRTGVELAKMIPSGHPLNAMGAGNIAVDFEGKSINPLVRIHGTNDPKSIGQRVTRGCIRLKNEDFLKLTEVIRGSKTTVIFE